MTKNENNITITGIVPSLTEFYEKAACVILPLFNDGGTKTKLLEAMAYGKPIVSTREGAKGFKNMNSIIITNDPKIFASSVSSILINGIDDGTLDKSRQLIHNHYTWDKIGNKLNNLIPTIAKV
jgi:glycosyltransferase involved in cell wall biosynthesis